MQIEVQHHNLPLFSSCEPLKFFSTISSYLLGSSKGKWVGESSVFSIKQITRVVELMHCSLQFFQKKSPA